MSFTEIENEALRLTEQERAMLAEHLLASLDEGATGLNEELWLDEAERRLEEYRAGKTTAFTAEEVFNDARRMLGG